MQALSSTSTHGSARSRRSQVQSSGRTGRAAMSESSMPPMRADWVGRRVVVRHSGESAEPPYHDIVGELVEITATHAVVRRADGERRRLPLDRVVAAKVVTASTPRHPSRLRRYALAAGAPSTRVWSRGWLLRADHGFTRRANSALPLRPIQVARRGRRRTAHDWYGARGLPAPGQLPVARRDRLWTTPWPTAASLRRSTWM